ncbi:GAF domain-containing protein [Oenococcus oeni]|uniref:GAF domain-containing protein n=1 Tax=Oenococcus oeni TaxID=1247 RepID=UPI0008F815D1|nr:GAF domain-containing protein [Oenococcus oeni]OIM23256.1 GAF domain-containing protein [Oenococcus oeni]
MVTRQVASVLIYRSDFFVGKRKYMETKQTRYSLLNDQAQSLLDGEHDLIANMSNLVSLIFNSDQNINGTTYYRLKNGELILGPFQGKPACVHIPLGRGVCGTAAALKETVIVSNVHKFEGHIACDKDSNSEIVVPIFSKNEFWGVLDLDSTKFNYFDKNDQEYLEKIGNYIFSI